jgi:hypothetical protein
MTTNVGLEFSATLLACTSAWDTRFISSHSTFPVGAAQSHVGFLAGARDFYFLQNVNISSGTHQASYSIATEGSFPEDKAVGT